MMPEGLVKISQTLYESILPLVRTRKSTLLSNSIPDLKTTSDY